MKERPFSDIWPDTSDPIMAGLKQRPRKIKGRCGACAHFDICGGNTRVRALQLTGDPWAEDPSCYLTDEEIGVAGWASAWRSHLTGGASMSLRTTCYSLRLRCRLVCRCNRACGTGCGKLYQAQCASCHGVDRSRRHRAGIVA